MEYFDVCNGDADGLCALQQLRLGQPRAAALVTGPKRDIALLERVPAREGLSLTVLDISLDRNRAALARLLARGATVVYFDHHHAGDVPAHPGLELHLDTHPGVCTSILVDRHLRGAHRPWAVVGAFGDNLPEAARALARDCGLDESATERLRVLGEAINYNAYGDLESDLLLAPARLAGLMRPYPDPLAFAEAEPVARQLAEAQAADMEAAWRTPAHHVHPGVTLYLLPDTAWARRVQGVFANALSQRAPARAHAVLRAAGGGYVASVRAPRLRPIGADRLCLEFGGGGGRAAAAGIDRLPLERLEDFTRALAEAFPA